MEGSQSAGVAGQAQEKAQQAAGQARGQLYSQVDQRSTQAGEQISSQASDIRSVAQQLREQGKEQPAKVAEQAADRAERVGGYLKESDADRILSDVEDFGRRQPVAVLLGGLALGFAASRVLKASSRQRYEQRGSAQGLGQIEHPTFGSPAPPPAPTTPPVAPTPPVPPASTVPPAQSPPPPPADPTRVDPAISPTGGVIR